MSYPEDLRYTREHEWLRLQDREHAVIGITQHAAEQLGDIVFVELPAVGTLVQQGKALGTIESVKAVSDLFAPISGEIVQINEALVAAPELVNQDPYGQGWLVVIKPRESGEVTQLLTSADYHSLLV